MSNSAEKQPILTFEEFLEIPMDCIKINCDKYIQKNFGANVYCVELIIHYSDISLSNIYCSNRNYSEFKDLFEAFTKKNPNEKFPEFPARLSFFQDDSRIKYFHKFLNKIFELSKDKNKKKENFEFLYNFIFGFNDIVINELTKEKIKEIFNKSSGESNSEDDDTNKSDNNNNNGNNNNGNSNNNNKNINSSSSNKKMRTYSSDKLIFDLSEEDKDSKDSKDSKSIENDDNKMTIIKV